MKKTFAILLSVLVLTLTACGGSSSYAKEAAAAAPMMDYAVAETAAADYAYDYGYEEEMAPAGGFAGNGYEGGSESAEVQNPNRKLIKNVYLDMETKDYEDTTGSIKRRINELGGYIENSDETTPSYNASFQGGRRTNITARIPSANLNEFVNNVEGSGNVTYKSENVQDITLQYSDTEARKTSLKAEQDRLNEFMKQAESVEDLITIEERLSEVRYELESIESRLRTYDNQVDYSTVTMNISEVTTYTPVKEATMGEKIKEGFTDCVEGLADFGEDLIVFIIAFSPLLALIAIIVVGIIHLIRRGKRNKPLREAKAAKKAAEREAKRAAKEAAKEAAKVKANEAKTE